MSESIEYSIVGLKNNILFVEHENKTYNCSLLIQNGKYPIGAELDELIKQQITLSKNQLNLPITASNEAEITALIVPSSRVLSDQEIINVVIAKRANLLLATDWTQANDSPLSEAEQISWKVYRQALRDITESSGYPKIFNWPVPPTVVKNSFGTTLTDAMGNPL